MHDFILKSHQFIATIDIAHITYLFPHDNTLIGPLIKSNKSCKYHLVPFQLSISKSITLAHLQPDADQSIWISAQANQNQTKPTVNYYSRYPNGNWGNRFDDVNRSSHSKPVILWWCEFMVFDRKLCAKFRCLLEYI